MKKILTILVVAMTALIGYAQAPQTLTDISNTYNKTCPKVAGDGLTLTSTEATTDAFVFLYSIDDQMFSNLATLGGILHDSLAAELSSSADAVTQQLITLCKSAKLPIITRFINTEGKTLDITISPDEL